MCCAPRSATTTFAESNPAVFLPNGEDQRYKDRSKWYGMVPYHCCCGTTHNSLLAHILLYPMVPYHTLPYHSHILRRPARAASAMQVKATAAATAIARQRPACSRACACTRWLSTSTTTAATPTITTNATTTSTSQHQSLEQVEHIANSVGVRLTPNELYMLRKTLNAHGYDADKATQFERYGVQALRQKTTREICLSSVANPENPVDKWGVRVISFFDYAGTSLFAIVGTQVAGDAGMNIVRKKECSCSRSVCEMCGHSSIRRQLMYLCFACVHRWDVV